MSERKALGEAYDRLVARGEVTPDAADRERLPRTYTVDLKWSLWTADTAGFAERAPEALAAIRRVLREGGAVIINYQGTGK